MFNFISGMNKTVKVKLAKSSDHYLMHSFGAISNITSVVFEPYNSNKKTASTDEYDSLTRVNVIIKDEGLSLQSLNTRFLLMSYFELDTTRILSMELFARDLIYNDLVSFPIFSSGVTFNNIRFEDEYTKTSIDQVTLFRTFKLEEKALELKRVDFKVLGTIMTTSYPMSFSAQHLKIIDYQNINAGFTFATNCNYEGASTTGDILFENVSFENESPVLDKLKSGSFINSSAPANLTVKDSVFKIHHREMEDFDVFKFEDSGLCTPEDDLTQYITFENNSVMFDNVEEGVFNNFYLSYIGANKRYKEIAVLNNTFTNMIGSVKIFLEIKNYSQGIVYVKDNYIFNCSSETDFFVLHANENIVAENNSFNTISATTKGLLVTDNAENVTISNLSLTNVRHLSLDLADPLIKISTTPLGHCVFEGAVFHSNNLGASVIDFDEDVGSLEFRNNQFYNEVLQSFNNYVTVDSLYKLTFTNTTFTNISDDKSNDRITQLVLINAITLDYEGEFKMDQVTVTNSSISFFSLTNLRGSTTTKKLITFENITVRDAVIVTRNNIITFGPMYSNEDVDFRMKNVFFENLNFVNGANLIQVYQQTRYPLLIDS